ncbi:AraC family transcriptional regulator [Cohnella phaseoli]|uniref:AraC-like DNA-binding protein n=3 Tax=Cohnella TaxID=329857 RepID=A0A3D9I730_9BACL|nr:AraC family transcriptional regulator [Cohnella phaseoli]RED57480.1 AraC-like DNA-binding protein [Cohnella phaseoli]
MNFLSLSSRSRLDVKWANSHTGDPLFFNTPHANPNFQLFLVNDGPVYLQVEEEKLTLHSGEILLLKPWQRHFGWKEGGEHFNFFWVQFSADPQIEEVDDETDYAQDLSFIGSSGDLRSAASTEIRMLLPRRHRPSCRFELALKFERMIAEMRKPAGYFRVRLSVLIWTVLELIANDFMESQHPDPATPESFILYRRIVNTLDENFQRELSKEMLEAAVDRTYNHICSVFKKYSGTTITAYTHSLRIQRAKYLLQTTGDTVAAIGREVGYDDPYYFGRLFKKITGVTPLEFRYRSGQ